MHVYTLVKLDTKRNEKDLYTLAFVLALTLFRKLRRFTTASAFVCFNKKFHYEVLTRSERERERKREYKISFYKMIIIKFDCISISSRFALKNILELSLFERLFILKESQKKEIQNNILTSKTSTSELWPEESKLERKKKQLDRSVKLGGGGRSSAILLFLRRLHARVRRETRHCTS